MKHFIANNDNALYYRDIKDIKKANELGIKLVVLITHESSPLLIHKCEVRSDWIRLEDNKINLCRECHISESEIEDAIITIELLK